MMFKAFFAVFKKEFSLLLYSPMSWIIMFIYAILSTAAAFYGGNYLNSCNSGLQSFFEIQPEVLLLVIPALSMRLWAAEKRQGTIESLLSQPLDWSTMVIGKFFAVWIFCFLMLLTSSGLWLTTSILGGISVRLLLLNITAVMLVAGAFCALSMAFSVLTKGSYSAFLLSLSACIGLKMLSFSQVVEISGTNSEILTRAGQALSFENHFGNMLSGQLTPVDLTYFLSVIVLSLWFNSAALIVGRR